MRLSIWLLLLVSFQLNGQNRTAFYANASSSEVMEGENFRVEFVMNNIKGSNFKPPVFDYFDVISGPSQTSSYSNNNGKVTQQYIYAYTLQAKKAGKVTIRSAYCDYKGQNLATSPFEITVVKRDSKSLKALGLPTDKDIFVRLEMANDTNYMGEKVMINYKLYTRKEVRSFDIKDASDFDGFFVIVESLRNEKAQREEIDGVTYTTQVIEKKALYPQQTGTFEIEPAKVILGLPDPNRRNTGFFFNSSLKQFQVMTNALTFHVVNLPSPAPESFSGAVGKFQMQADVDKSKLSTDDALTLTITVAGNGDPKYILPPEQAHLNDFEIYEPSIKEKGEREMFGEIQTIKSFEYLVVPQKAGRQNLQARFTYFDTEQNKYVTLKSKVFPLMVEQGSASGTVNIDKTAESDRNLSSLMPELKLFKQNNKILGRSLHFGLLGLSFLGIGFIFYKKKQMDIEAGIDPSLKKRRKALSLAEKRLSKAQEFLNANDHKSFYEEISRSMLGFIADKLNVPNSEISKSNVAAKLRAENAENEKVDELVEVLSKAEVAVFAGKKDGDLEDVYNKSKDLLSYLGDRI